REDVGNHSGLSLSDAIQIELQLDLFVVHRRLFQLVVIVTGNGFVAVFSHATGRLRNLCRESGRMIARPGAMTITSLFRISTLAAAMPLAFALLLLAILIISFRSRAVVFCQYLQTMTGIKLRPADVRRVYSEGGADAVRAFFLDLIIREDLKQGPIEIPPDGEEETHAETEHAAAE